MDNFANIPQDQPEELVTEKARDSQPQNEAQISLDLFRRYNNSARQAWANHVREDEMFRHNVQFTAKQRTTLEQRGHAAVPINQIDPAVEAAKALMTSRKPGWVCVGREDTDVKLAKVCELLLEYTYDISNGRMVVGNGVEDYLAKSMLACLVYYDHNAFYGKGRVKFIDIDPLEVYIDPASRRRDAEDASNIMIVKEVTVEQAIRYFPAYAPIIRAAAPMNENIYPEPNREAGEGQVFPGDVDDEQSDKRIIIERYTKRVFRVNRIRETFSQTELALSNEELENYLLIPYLQFGQTVIRKDNQQELAVLLSQIDPAQLDALQEVTGAELVKQGIIQIEPVDVTKVCRIISVGDKLIAEEIMNIDEYPIKFAMNKWNRTPYPESDVRFAKGINLYINKFNSLLMAHAIRSVNIPLLIPRGSANIKVVREEWLKPDAVIDYSPEFGTPFTPQVAPLAAEAFNMVDRWKRDIQYQFGIPELMHGFTQDAPNTFRGTMAMEEYGQRKIQSKLRDIEDALMGLGRVAIKLIQQYYTEDEIVRVIQPSGQVSEVRINYMGVDDYSGELRKLNDISTVNIDVKVLAGSTLPSNRWGQFDYYVQLYNLNAIDQVELLKKTELVDVDGVLNRMSHIKQLEQIVQQQEQEIKRLRGDLQTAERESVHDRKRIEVEKFKTGLKGIESEARAATSVFDSRLNDELGNIKTEVRENNKSVAEQSKRRKENV